MPSIEDMYRDISEISPAARKIGLLVVNAMVICVTIFLIWVFVDMYQTGIMDVLPGSFKNIFAMMLGVLIILSIGQTFFTYVTFKKNTQYEIKGEIKLALRYEPGDAFRINPGLGMIALFLVSIVILIPVILFVLTGELPGGLGVAGMALGAMVFFRNTFAKKHYLLTDEGFGLFIMGFRPLMVFWGWSTFTSYTVDEESIYLNSNLDSMIADIMLPRKIPAFEKLNQVQSIIQQYLPEE
ncbi:MAG: hypothetical protein KAU14_06185 [Thermoplasmata archaeon]|nr:hypothetical protein [Thermoplasmata archaeon]